MKIYYNPEFELWCQLTSRAEESNRVLYKKVSQIVEDVKKRGDSALYYYTQKFDNIKLDKLYLDKKFIEESIKHVDDNLKRAIDVAYGNIHLFHSYQTGEVVDVVTFPGVRCVLRKLPIEKVALYVPGGSAPLFSTVLMLAIPAKIAGCSDITLFTPPDKNGKISPVIAYAALKCGIENIVTVGGAQAIAAMAFGTGSIKKVDKIFGPGNLYVSVAKQIVSSSVSIDMVAGPSELMILADESCDADFVAADLLSQAEHGPDSQVFLVTNKAEIAEKCIDAVERQRENLPRREHIDGALSNSRVIVLDSTDDIVDFANLYAPEHLSVMMNNPWEVAKRIKAAGSVFIGNYSPESAGDYASGTNHTLPTGGWAKSVGSLSLDSFRHTITYQELTKKGLLKLNTCISEMAKAEGLTAHMNAAQIRINKLFNAKLEK